MTLSLEIKKRNWKVLSKYITTHKGYTIGLKKVYLGEEEGHGIPSYVRLLLTPELTPELLQKYFNDDPKNNSVLGTMTDLQMNYHYYFGNNSYYNHNESLIYDHYDFHGIDAQKLVADSAKSSSFTSLDEFFLTAGPLRRYLSYDSVGDHVQLWRSVYEWSARIKNAPDNAKSVVSDIYIPYTLRALELVHRNPGYYDSNIVKVVNLMRDAILESSDYVRSYYQLITQDDVESQLENYCTGCDVTVCVRYNTPEQAQAMVDQLNPATRYPYSKDNDVGIVHGLLSREASYRPSEFIVHSMWKCGTKVEYAEVIEGSTLIFKTKLSIFNETLKGLCGIVYDATNLTEKYDSKKSLKGDANIHNVKKFPAVAVAERRSGGYSVGFPNQYYFVNLEKSRKFENISESTQNVQDLCLMLLDENHYKTLCRYYTKKMREIEDERIEDFAKAFR